MTFRSVQRARSSLLRVVLVALTYLTTSLAAAQCAHAATHDLTTELEGITTVRVESRAGDVAVVGHADTTTVRAVGSACASSRAYLEDIQLEVVRTESTLTLRAVTPNVMGFMVYARMDLVVDLPEGVALEIEDGSGDVDVRGVASLWLEDASGDVHASEVGKVTVLEDGSGLLSFVDVAGDLDILTDYSGEIVIERVGGSARIGRDGSGDIDVRSVEGDVRIDEDASGNVAIQDVGNDVYIGNDGTGDIRIRNVGGSVTIDRDASGDIDIVGVGGDVAVGPAGSGRVRVEEVTGTVDVP